MHLRPILVKSVWQARAGTQAWFGAVNMILGTLAYLKITHSEAPAPSRRPASQLPFAVNPSNQHSVTAGMWLCLEINKLAPLLALDFPLSGDSFGKKLSCVCPAAYVLCGRGGSGDFESSLSWAKA